METQDKIENQSEEKTPVDPKERMLSWIKSCTTDEQLVNIRMRIGERFGTISEDLRSAIDDQRIEIIKNKDFILSVPTLAYNIF